MQTGQMVNFITCLSHSRWPPTPRGLSTDTGQGSIQGRGLRQEERGLQIGGDPLPRLPEPWMGAATDSSREWGSHGFLLLTLGEVRAMKALRISKHATARTAQLFVNSNI